jgi:hypothetical protein
LSKFEPQNWRGAEFKLIHLDIIRKMDGQKAVDKFVAENLQTPKIREIAFDKAIAYKNFKECERLCIEALPLYEGHYGISPWLYKLFAVYDAMKNEAKMAETAESILLKGDMAYYDKLKFLLKTLNTWDTSYTELLGKCEAVLSYSQYMEILAKENEYVLLLEQVKKHPELSYPEIISPLLC